jgi:hypothetical protein
MSAEQLHQLVGRRIVEEDGRPLGRIVGITHHWDGRASALVSGGRWPWSDGFLLDLDGAVLVDDDVHLRRAHPSRPVVAGHRHR